MINHRRVQTHLNDHNHPPCTNVQNIHVDGLHILWNCGRILNTKICLKAKLKIIPKNNQPFKACPYNHQGNPPW